MHMRTLCCAVYTMKGSGLGHCSMQLAGGCVPFNLKRCHQAAFSFCWEGPCGKTMCYVIFFK